MSFSSVGGFQGGDALLAFAAIQQGRMNQEMTDAMKLADKRSQMTSDLNDIKAHLEIANNHPERFNDLDVELQAFMAEYGDIPAFENVTTAVGEIAANVHGRLADVAAANGNGYGSAHAQWEAQGKSGPEPQPPGPPQIGSYGKETIKSWTDNITAQLDASGTNDQLAMIHIKQLNDNINNSSGVVSGIIESRNNATSSIINNIA
jgi:hypothetical protein